MRTFTIIVVLVATLGLTALLISTGTSTSAVSARTFLSDCITTTIAAFDPVGIPIHHPLPFHRLEWVIVGLIAKRCMRCVWTTHFRRLFKDA